ncbi:hypothetical protein B296_00046692 [Ensete ventricosum]|uniref:Uncharacterized protein n=1 Tax=Ensete ventricosum TaxID=4639 RepID=A0A426XEX2_ENSVE|nr:hypothetical protein B296_00046692 [Ensete ventricosum]
MAQPPARGQLDATGVTARGDRLKGQQPARGDHPQGQQPANGRPTTGAAPAGRPPAGRSTTCKRLLARGEAVGAALARRGVVAGGQRQLPPAQG